MRNNQPVSNNEYIVRDGAAIISRTDRNGMLVECNDEFVEASGFELDELLGQPHNLVRHPDMPREAFRDMWATLKANRPWSGFVKNRRKNGDFYWVKATATPLADGSGFMSVRVKASRSEVAKAEALYRQLNNDPASRLSEGVLHRPGLFSSLANSFADLNISTKIYLLNMVGALVFIASVVLGMNGLNQTRMALQSVYLDRTVVINDLAKISANIRDNALETVLNQGAGTQLEASILRSRQRSQEVSELWNHLKSKMTASEELALVEQFEEKRGAWLNTMNDALSRKQQGKLDIDLINNAFYERATPAIAVLDQLMALQKAKAAQAYQASEAGYADIVSVEIISALVGAAFLGVLTLLITRQIKKSITSTTEFAEAIANGDLLKSLPPANRNELGMLIVKMAVMRNSLHELIASIRTDIDRLTRHSASLSKVAVETKDSALHQSELAASMSAATEELSVSVDQIGEHAAETHSASNTSGECSLRGASVIGNVVEDMGEISRAVALSAESVDELAGISQEISTIAGVINDIADQTNLLALNAAIEAARAGETGRGFAVVADEVRKLAERTTNSTKEIAEMIHKTQIATSKAAAEMRNVVSRVSEGVELVGDAGNTMASIQSSTDLVLQAVEGINFSLSEQSSATREIARQVEEVALASESNALRATNIESAATTLHGLVNTLKAQASKFRIA